MTLKFNCPGCNSQLKIHGPQQAGSCPHCSQPLNIKIVVSVAMEETPNFSKPRRPKAKPSRPWKCSGVPHGVEKLARARAV